MREVIHLHFSVSITHTHTLYARFQTDLPEYIPCPPEMTFADNCLQIEYNKDFSLKFTALEALRLVMEEPTVEKVSCSNAWKAARFSSLFTIT